MAGTILGVGPAFLYPSGTDERLGGEKWGAGPTAVALRQNGGWTYGMLANHLWSFAGNEDRRSVNATFVQPLVSYITKTRPTFTVNTEATYDWNESQWLGACRTYVCALRSTLQNARYRVFIEF